MRTRYSVNLDPVGTSSSLRLKERAREIPLIVPLLAVAFQPSSRDTATR